jgi:hypothetical protein
MHVNKHQTENCQYVNICNISDKFTLCENEKFIHVCYGYLK